MSKRDSTPPPGSARCLSRSPVRNEPEVKPRRNSIEIKIKYNTKEAKYEVDSPSPVKISDDKHTCQVSLPSGRTLLIKTKNTEKEFCGVDEKEKTVPSPVKK